MHLIKPRALGNAAYNVAYAHHAVKHHRLAGNHPRQLKSALISLHYLRAEYRAIRNLYNVQQSAFSPVERHENIFYLRQYMPHVLTLRRASNCNRLTQARAVLKTTSTKTESY
jgi:hypothetical protein